MKQIHTQSRRANRKTPLGVWISFMNPEKSNTSAGFHLKPGYDPKDAASYDFVYSKRYLAMQEAKLLGKVIWLGSRGTFRVKEHGRLRDFARQF